MKISETIKYTAATVAALGAFLLFTSSGPGDFRLGRNMEIMVNMFRELNTFYVDSVDTDQLLSDAAAGMVRRLDPYTDYISEEDMQTFEVLTTGKYGGIGSLIRQSGDYVVFAEPYEGSPADRAGIRIGDRLVEIEGRDAKGMSTEEVSKLLKGEAGTHVKMKIERLLTGETAPLKIRREIITLPGIPWYGFVSDSIGYIAHSDFTEDCSADMRRALEELRSSGKLKGLVLDYRGNGGGILQEAVKTVSLFVPKGTEVASMQGRSEEQNAVFATETEPVDTLIPIAALVDGATASSAEIVTGAMQDLDRAVLIGQRTFGKGLVQSTRPLGYNAWLKLTTAKYYLPSGRCIQAVDYTRRNEDGSIGFVPDSLISEFSTAGGRKVYDGGGVMPDSVLAPDYLSRFTRIVLAKGYIDDFADAWNRDNPDREVVPGNFSLTEADYDAFVEFMSDKDVEWQSETELALKALREKASRELYLSQMESQLDALDSLLTDDTAAGLQLYRRDMTEIIESAIVLRRSYARGVARHSVAGDPAIAAAVDVLKNTALYTDILAHRDTARK